MRRRKPLYSLGESYHFALRHCFDTELKGGHVVGISRIVAGGSKKIASSVKQSVDTENSNRQFDDEARAMTEMVRSEGELPTLQIVSNAEFRKQL